MSSNLPIFHGWIKFYELLTQHQGQVSKIEEIQHTTENEIFIPVAEFTSEQKRAFLQAFNSLKTDKEKRSTFNTLLENLEIPLEKQEAENYFTEYEKLLTITKLAYAYEKNGVPEEFAIKLVLAFGNYEKAMQYLKEFEEANPTAEKIHDACNFSLPKGQWNRKIWQELARLHFQNNKFTHFLIRAKEIENWV